MIIIFREDDGKTGNRLTIGERKIDDGQYLQREGRYITADGGRGGGGFTGLASPSGLIGLTPINGSATTGLRSDGRHAIDQGITPTWTGMHIFGNYVRFAKVWHGYGGFEDQAETIACGVGDWNHITNGGNNLWSLDKSDGITIAADVLTIVNSGDYEGTMSLSLSGLNGKDFHVRVYNITQALVEGRPMGISTTGANNEMNIAVPIYIEAVAGDEIQFEIMSADGADPVVDDGIFIIKYLHDLTPTTTTTLAP